MSIVGLRSRWQHQDFDMTLGNTYRNRLTITRPEYAGYEVTGHSAAMRLKARGAESTSLEVSLNPVGTPTLETVDGVPNTLVAEFELIVAPGQTASLETGGLYNYAVSFTDSLGDTTTAVEGVIYAKRSL